MTYGATYGNQLTEMSLQTSPNCPTYLALLPIKFSLDPSGMASGNLPEPSGTQAKQQLQTSFRQPSGNLPGPSGTAVKHEERSKLPVTLPETFRKPSGPFRNSAFSEMLHLG